jgi:hypothetical protein
LGGGCTEGTSWVVCALARVGPSGVWTEEPGASGGPPGPSGVRGEGRHRVKAREPPERACE